MHVAKNGGSLLLAIVSLWVITPLFACIMPAGHRDCCRGMQTCGPSAKMDPACCQFQQSKTPAVPISLSGPERPPVAANTLLPQFAIPSHIAGDASHAFAEPPPPFNPSGLRSNLRI